MTERLYYTDPYNREFDATIARVDLRDGRAHVTLDRTSFYPTSGGQPFDTGTLGALHVVDVVDEDDGTITHVIEDVGHDFSRADGGQDPNRADASLVVGRTVHGAIDWARRFDHMQQHTGQHVLSAAFDRLFGVRTVSFHLGASASTIDLAPRQGSGQARELAPRDIAAAEGEANRIVWENRPVTIRFADAEDAAKLPLRKEPKREGRLRLIDVENFDLSACGGTHVAHTGAIGIIAIGSWERFKGGQRIEFRCGGRALDRLRSLRDTVAAAMRLLSVTAEELPEAIERFQAEARDQKRTVTALQTELARHRAAELAASGEVTARGRLVLRAMDADGNSLKSLAAAITVAPGFVAVLVSTSTPSLAVVARSADVAVPANQVLAALTARFGGRGGGKPELAQGGGLSGSPQDILDAAKAAILA
jgi:alanyl-tRNA synthetase